MKLIITIFLFLFSFSVHEEENILLTTSTGEVIESKDILQNGRQKVIVFWSSYCRLCKYEMKGIRNIGANWHDDYQADIVFVSLENYPSSAYKKLEFLNDFHNDGIYKLHDNDMTFYESFKGESIPTSLLLDGTGKVLHRWDAYDDGLERSIGMYLKKYATQEVNLK